MASDLAADTVALLQVLIRNRCVNDGTPGSGHESRNADVLQSYVEGPGVEIERWEPLPGRASFVARLPGRDPAAPKLLIMGHTDVVPVTPAGWREDPFGGEIIRSPEGHDEVWGRGAVDMLGETAAQAVVFKALAGRGFQPSGDLIYFAVADEEAGSTHGARWVADHHPEAIRADYVLTESGGIHGGQAAGGHGPHTIGVTVAEKGVAWRRLRVHGTPGHGSMPYGADNALVKAAAVVRALAGYRPAPRFHELWRAKVESFGLPADDTAALLDDRTLDAWLDERLAADRAAGRPSPAVQLHACSHTTFSPNVIRTVGRPKTNVIPDVIDLDVDIRTMPGEGTAEVEAHLRAALGDAVLDSLGVEVLIDDPASTSRIGTPLWDALQRAVNSPFPEARLSPAFTAGFTDARIFRELGAVAYGAGLKSPILDAAEFSRRFHGHDERIDVESLRLTAELFDRVITDLLG